jgi:hypothetical protein
VKRIFHETSERPRPQRRKTVIKHSAGKRQRPWPVREKPLSQLSPPCRNVLLFLPVTYVQRSTSSSSPPCRLDERRRRRDFILERGLLNLKKQQALDRKRTREERELYNRARVFARFTRYAFYLSGKVGTSWNLRVSSHRGAKYELRCCLCVVLESSLRSGSSFAPSVGDVS